MEINNITNKQVYHGAFGQGQITSLIGNLITVVFESGTKQFQFPRGFQNGYLATDDVELKDFIESSKVLEEISPTPEKAANNGIPFTKIIFLNIAWMKYYHWSTSEDIPTNGGKYVDENQRGNEDQNFLPIEIEGEDGIRKNIFLGSYETKSTNGETSNKTHIEKIPGCQLLKNQPCAKGVLVVFCATPKEGGKRVIGWYKNATVYRDYQVMNLQCADGVEYDRYYNVTCDASDAVLLPESVRSKDEWYAPLRNDKKNNRFGFFWSNVWYGKEPEAQNYIKNLFQRIEKYQDQP